MKAHRILLVGQGGREHALAHLLSQSPSCDQLHAYPGSDGMSPVALSLGTQMSKEVLQEQLAAGAYDLCVVGPEQYLADGWTDRCRAAGVRGWGPGKTGVQLEISKAFAKGFMERHGIPTARAAEVHDAEAMMQAIDQYPVVLKFDGLAAGKGVAICKRVKEAMQFADEVFHQRRFGKGSVLVERFLQGPEVSIMATVADGQYHLFPPARDYKRLQDQDAGPNTGGMGAVAAVDLITSEQHAAIVQHIVEPTIRGLQEDQLSYRGFLYFGIMLTSEGPMLLEYNCRFGDPEAQAILPLVQGDFAQYLFDAAGGSVNPELVSFSHDWSVCVVAATATYPAAASSSTSIQGLTNPFGIQVFHSGTRQEADGRWITNGGRVLAVHARRPTRLDAVEAVYAALSGLQFEGMHFRHDIGRYHFDSHPHTPEPSV